MATLEIHADEIDGFAGDGDRHVGPAQNPHSGLPEEGSDRVLNAGPGVVVAQAAVDSERRAQSLEGLDHGLLRGGVESDEVAGEHHQVGL